MEDLMIPKKLKKGDTIAFISLSGGRAGDEDMLPRYNLAKERFSEAYGVNVVETPYALAGNQYLYEHPEKRAEDLMWALENSAVNGIICNMGGDDSYRVFPYIDTKIITNNPKVFMGYSDIASWMCVFAYAGVRAYYGPNVLTPIGAPVKFDDYTKEAIRKILFDSSVIGEIKPCLEYSKIEWNDHIKPHKIKWFKNDGYKVINGSGIAKGKLFNMMPGPLRQIMGTKYFPKPDFFEDTILTIEHGSPYGSHLAGLHDIRSLAAAGVFDKAVGIITGALDEESRNTIKKVLIDEVHRDDIVILENVDFVHRTPMTVLPMGVSCEIDCDKKSFTITESGVQ